MKNALIRLVVLLVSGLFLSGSARAAELIINNWDVGYSFVEMDSKDREVSNIDDPASVPMYNLMKVQTMYAGTMPTLVDGALHMGTAMADLSAYNHSVSLEYRWNTAMNNVDIEFDYTARTNTAAGTYLRVVVGYHADMYATGFTQWVYEVYRTTNSGYHVITSEEINSITGNKEVNVVYIQECKIGTGDGGIIDNIVIAGGDTGMVEAPVDEVVVNNVVENLPVITDTVYVDRIVVKEVIVEVPVEKIVYVDKIVEVPVEVIKYVEVEVEVPVYLQPEDGHYYKGYHYHNYKDWYKAVKKDQKSNNGKHLGHDKKAQANGYKG